MKGLANLQRESTGETPCQQVEQLLRDDGFLMLRSVRAEDLFLERTLISLQNYWKLIYAFSKAWGQFIFGRCLYERVNHSGICWVCALHAGRPGNPEGPPWVSSWRLSVSYSINRINTREHQNCALIFFWLVGCVLSVVIFFGVFWCVFFVWFWVVFFVVVVWFLVLKKTRLFYK